jgi:aspartyl-tRNA(Asn)/glutamyl-tRNA(Gln) amidotransferase subunit B
MIDRGGDHVLPVIGLEIHVQLATRTKMFCRCPNRFGDPPNTNVCPVCLGLPGSLPVINRSAVQHAVHVGLALGARVAEMTKWDRKAYFYPDLPKNYQISQYDEPLASAGTLEIAGPEGSRKNVRIRRAHLEEDAGKNIHDNPGYTGVDLNRAGTPLLEIVTEPDLNAVGEVMELARSLHRLVRWLGASEANMEMGQMRFEPNVNLRIEREGRVYKTPIIEVKNLNSFRSLEAAVAFEIDRQYQEWLEDPEGRGREKLGKQNRGFDPERGETVFQREKEEAHDYRYFPDPDLVPVRMPAEAIAALAGSIGELPWQREERYRSTLGLSARNAEALTQDRGSSDLFDESVGKGADAVRLANLLVGKGSALANQRGCSLAQLGLGARRLADLTVLLATERVTATSAARLLELALTDGRPVEDIAAAAGLLLQKDPAAVRRWVEEALAANPQAREDVLSGGKKQAKALGFLVGQVMQRAGGAAPPNEVQRVLREMLELG